MTEVEAEKSYSGLERFMFFLTPILFTLVLVGVLLTLFSPDVRSRMLETANRIPLLERIVPDPPAGGKPFDEKAIRERNMGEKIAELESQLAAKETELAELAGIRAELEAKVAQLEARVEELTRQNEERQLTDEEYQARISELAQMFGQISPSKAAPILESMTIEEMVLIMDAMRPEIRVSIMEKMTPGVAAEATIRLKDTVTAKDRQIAALQARINEYESERAEHSANLSDDQIILTFSSMSPDSAAQILLQMASLNQAKVLELLGSIPAAARANIIEAMNSRDSQATAQLVHRLVAR
ncbi:MAG: MgtE protein [Thermobacillus sp. ZCTH02-B1]|nr:MAG: MgtE protein [Thermobacillus sp. ZCTH02-B1]